MGGINSINDIFDQQIIVKYERRAEAFRCGGRPDLAFDIDDIARKIIIIQNSTKKELHGVY